MRAHNGMRPHDIIILLKLCHAKDKRQVTLSKELFMSQSEISDSLARSVIAGLIDSSKKTVYTNNLLEFIAFGIKYTFPVVSGKVTKGIPTASSASPLKEEILSNVNYVWPWHKGELRGESIQPLHENLHKAVLQDNLLHSKMAMVDAIRLRNPRESELAIRHLRKILIDGQ